MANLTVADVAKYILDNKGIMSAMKLHKLVYYSQAWSLVWDDEPLFEDAIEAWANGPVVRSLYNIHKGMYQVSSATFANSAKNDLSENQKDTIDTVIEAYSEKSAQWLSDQTHLENPWIIARSDLADNERGEKVITLENMAEYYSSI
ncbi:MAG: DUF4065 domain-containing protein [Thiomargarita sp.]|nr:DUF4065 domain-containing protein [Thiomargarita sp.]